jgi:hypothetical protein
MRGEPGVRDIKGLMPQNPDAIEVLRDQAFFMLFT